MIGESQIIRALDLIGQQEAFGPDFHKWMEDENIDESALNVAAEDHVAAAKMVGVQASKMSFLAGFCVCLMILRHIKGEDNA